MLAVRTWMYRTARYVMIPVTARMIVNTDFNFFVSSPVHRKQLVGLPTDGTNGDRRTVSALLVSDANIAERQLLWQRENRRGDELDQGNATCREEHRRDYDHSANMLVSTYIYI